MREPINRQVIAQKTYDRKQGRDRHYHALPLMEASDLRLIQQMQLFIGAGIPRR
jgi:hypothetical protein